MPLHCPTLLIILILIQVDLELEETGLSQLETNEIENRKTRLNLWEFGSAELEKRERERFGGEKEMRRH